MLKETPNLTLRPFEIEDWPILSHWFYSGNYREFFRDVSTALTISQFSVYANMVNGQCFLARLKDDNKNDKAGSVVGLVMVYEINWAASIAKIGILIDEKFQNKRFSMESIWSIGDYLINKMRLRKIVVECLEENEKLAHIVSVGGFKKEATLISECVIDGVEKNVTRYCIFSEEAKTILKEYGDRLWFQQ